MPFTIIFTVVPILVFVVFGVVIVKLLSQWHKNNNSPRLSVSATVVTKRTYVSHMHTTGDNTFSTPSTDYYATFEVESGDRMEFRVSGTEYGELCEGDFGKLTFQGTRYICFDRNHGM